MQLVALYLKSQLDVRSEKPAGTVSHCRPPSDFQLRHDAAQHHWIIQA